MKLLPLSACYLVNKNDATVTFSLLLSENVVTVSFIRMMLLSLSACYLVNKNDATVTFRFQFNKNVTFSQ